MWRYLLSVVCRIVCRYLFSVVCGMQVWRYFFYLWPMGEDIQVWRSLLSLFCGGRDRYGEISYLCSVGGEIQTWRYRLPVFCWKRDTDVEMFVICVPWDERYRCGDISYQQEEKYLRNDHLTPVEGNIQV